MGHPLKPKDSFSRLWETWDFVQAQEIESGLIVGSPRDGREDHPEVGTGVHIARAHTTVGDLITVETRGSRRCVHDLRESDLDNLNSVLKHEVSGNTMKNYRSQWRKFIIWALGRGIRARPPGRGLRP